MRHVLKDHILGGRRSSQGGTLASTLLPAATNSATYDADNRLTNWGGSGLTYDTNGNMLTAGSGTFTWNAINQLIASSGSGVNASYGYDALGRRQDRTVGSTNTGFLYDGLNPVQELSGSTVTANIVGGRGIDEVLSRTDSVGSRYFQNDALQSTKLLTDGTGAVKTTYSYDAYGLASASGESNSNPYQYSGRENDNTGLYYYRNRYYSPYLYRFISEDPIGLDGGPDLYAYVGGNPISLTDPWGLDPHNYSVFVPLCSGCTAADGFNAMRSFSAPGAPYAQDGTHDLVLTGNNPIRQTVDPCKKTITNTTLPGHIFGGQVVISIVENNGFVGAQVVGSGDGPNATLNQFVGPLIFDALGLQASYSLSLSHGVQ